MLGLPAFGAQDVPSPASRTAAPEQKAPRPSTADSKALPAVFNKAAPGSIADLKTMEQQVKTVLARVSPAVVAVEVGFASGSGVVISERGLVLTAGHVCGRADRDVRFTFPDGRTVHGKTLGVDHDSDTGLMRITDPGLWPYAPTGDLDGTRIGDWVLALGHPGGFDPRRSLVVRLGRIIRLAEEAIQTDCTISPGDSGGPLFDMYGRVIGIHSAISRSVAENFHVPISEFYLTWNKLANGGGTAGGAGRPKAYVGATVSDDSAGCRVSEVEENGPAFKAGLRAGDLIFKVDDRDIKIGGTFSRWVGEARPGETLTLQVKRADKTLSVKVILQAQPAPSRKP